MNKIKSFISLFWVCQSAVACIDLPQAFNIGQSMAHTYYELLCSKPLTKKNTQSILAHSLPHIMSPRFLGATPPPHWQELINWWLEQCDWEGDLCTDEAQRQFVFCSQKLSPLMLIEISPWLDEHCEALNQHLIKQWALREPELKHIINQALQQVKTNE